MPDRTLRHHLRSHSNPDGNLSICKSSQVIAIYRWLNNFKSISTGCASHAQTMNQTYLKSPDQHITHMQTHTANYVPGMYTDGDLVGHRHACLSEHRHTLSHARAHSCPNREMGNTTEGLNHSAPPLLGHRQCKCKPSSTPKHTQSQTQSLRQ